MRSYHIECYILQTLYGIIPEELWKEHRGAETDPFENMSEEAARKLKRKFRKLKRILNVSREDKPSKIWRSGNVFIRRKMKE